jgi:hypothetical protein
MSALDGKFDEIMCILIRALWLAFEGSPFPLGELSVGGELIEPCFRLLAVLIRKVVSAFKSERKPLGQEAALDGQLQQLRFPEKREVMRKKDLARRALAWCALGFAIGRAKYRPFKELLNPRRAVSFTKLLLAGHELPVLGRWFYRLAGGVGSRLHAHPNEPAAKSSTVVQQRGFALPE